MGQLGEAADSQGRRTTPETAQQIIAGLYTNSRSNPILAGGQVTGTATLAYHVAAGVGVLRTAAGAKYVTWDETDTALTTPPETGTQVDTIGVDADGVVHLDSGGGLPGNHVIIGTFRLPAGATATTAATDALNRRYALPYGANLGQLAYWQENAPVGSAAAQEWSMNLSCTVPSDRKVRLEIVQELKTPGLNELNPGAILWTVVRDGAQTVRFELPVDRRRVIRRHQMLFELSAGSHTFRITRRTQWLLNNTTVTHFGGGDGYSNGYYRIVDEGPVE